MRPWHSVVVPHRDIRDGRFDESVFAASLSDVVKGRGPLEYRDAATFFRKTYPTQGLVKLLAAVVGRLAGAGHGEAVIQIQTPFGGGKTHALVALYHLLRAAPTDGEVAERVLQASGAAAIPPTRVLTFDGLDADPLGGMTPWGELAAQLGRYDVLKEHDQRRRATGKDLLHQLLSDAPTLIVMDEIAEYATKVKDFREQVMAFFQELTETVKVLPHCSLVVTLPSSSSVPYGEEGERTLRDLERIFGRVEAIYTPIEGVEMYEVIRRRLFEDLGDPNEATLVADEYWQLYQRLGDDVAAVARDLAHRDRMRRAYPFHPQLVDTLYERWSTFPTFQRTRGALRLLALVVADLYQREHPASLIQPAHLNLADPRIRREFLKHIGNEYEGIVAADIVDSNAKAQRMDREMGSEYARFGVASGLATAIFFGSFSGSERRGINAAGLRLSFLREGIPPAIVGDALGRLEDELWFLHVEGGLYQFRNQPNLNRVMLEREEAVSEQHIAAEIRARLQRLAGTEMKSFLFPAMSADVPDNRELKLAILGGEHPSRGPAATAFVEELVNKSGVLFRTYRNTVLALAADAGEFASARQLAKRFLALRSIQDDRNLLRTLSDENRRTLDSKHRDATSGIDWQLRLAYRHLARAGGSDGVVWLDTGMPTTGERGSFAKHVYDFLKSQDMLLDRLAPRHVLEKAFGPDEPEKRVGDVFEAFLRYPHLPLLDSEAVLRRAVAQGVGAGTFGVRIGQRLVLREPVSELALDQESVVVRPEVAERELVGQIGPVVITPPPGPDTGGVIPPPGPKPIGVTTLVLRVRVPWDRMADFVRGVLMPLRADEATLSVEITLDARSPGGIKNSTIDQTVQETLRQIGAEVLEDRRSP